MAGQPDGTEAAEQREPDEVAAWPTLGCEKPAGRGVGVDGPKLMVVCYQGRAGHED